MKLLKDIVIKKGTELHTAPDQRGGVEAIIPLGKDSTAYFNVPLGAVEDAPEYIA